MSVFSRDFPLFCRHDGVAVTWTPERERSCLLVVACFYEDWLQNEDAFSFEELMRELKAKGEQDFEMRYRVDKEWKCHGDGRDIHY